MANNPKREINPVSNNEEKRKTYQALKGKLSRALKQEFYLEAMLIDYALMEDRLRSYLYYMGIFSDRGQIRANKKTKNEILSIIQKQNLNNIIKDLDVKSISGKIQILESLAKWSAYDTHIDDGEYLLALNKSFENIDVQYLLDILNEIGVWKRYRNEVIHGLMNKNLESLDEKLADKALEGKKLAEQLDNQLKLFKKGNYSRRILKLSNN